MGLELLERRRFELEAGCRRGVLLPVLGRAGPVAPQLEASLREGVWRLASGLLAAAGRAGPVGVWLLPVLGRAGPVAPQLEASLREGVWRLASGLLAAAGRAGPVGVWLQAAEKRLAVDRAGLGASQLEAE